MTLLADHNHARHRPGAPEGHYESFYQRANHPSRPLAFWIRYTIFSPANRPQDAIGELWAIWFDGESGAHVAVKGECPLADCEFARDRFFARVEGATLAPGRLTGAAERGSSRIGWDLTFAGKEPLLLLMPEANYAGNFPKAKSLVGLPLARYDGSLTVDGQRIPIDGWVGSQNHNWGLRHTDHYFFGQVAGFDNAPDSFLECASARLRMGPLWTPWLTPMVLRHRGREYVLNRIAQSIFRTRCRTRYFEWEFTAEPGDFTVTARFNAPGGAFVGLTYYNPPGGVKHCLNTKIAACEVHLTDPRNGIDETLTCRHRALLEIVPPTDHEPHGIPIRI